MTDVHGLLLCDCCCVSRPGSSSSGLVSYLPAADPRVFTIREGLAALPTKLAAAAQLEGLHLGSSIQTVTATADGYILSATCEPTAGRQPDEQQHGSFDTVIISAPLEGSGMQLQGLDPQPRLPKRRYQSTVTTYVTGAWKGAVCGWHCASRFCLRTRRPHATLRLPQRQFLQPG
jgi:protoporphyrinogen oxidase